MAVNGADGAPAAMSAALAQFVRAHGVDALCGQLKVAADAAQQAGVGPQPALELLLREAETQAAAAAAAVAPLNGPPVPTHPVPTTTNSISPVSGIAGTPVSQEPPAAPPPKRRTLYTEVTVDRLDAQTLEELDFEQSVVFFTGEECDPNGDGIPEDVKRGAGASPPLRSIKLEVVYKPFCNSLEESVNFPIHQGVLIAGRYRIAQQLGSGVFSHAVQCEDVLTGRQVCIKVIRNNKDFLDQSLGEIKLLQYLNDRDPRDEHHVLRMLDYFYYREHLFIVCELMRDNLYEMYKYVQNHAWPRYFTVTRVLSVARQCLDALAFIHSCCLIHCDLKPENILIQSQSRCIVKVIDFGSSCFVRDPHSSYVQSRSYRAPEVVLGLPYSCKIDVWSLGCILAELYAGEVLFRNRDVRTLLAAQEAVLGPLPEHMVRRGRHSHLYALRGRIFARPDDHSAAYRYLVPQRTSLKDMLRTDDDEFVAFLSALLELDPAKRLSAAEALAHPALLRQEVHNLPLYIPHAQAVQAPPKPVDPSVRRATDAKQPGYAAAAAAASAATPSPSTAPPGGSCGAPTAGKVPVPPLPSTLPPTNVLSVAAVAAAGGVVDSPRKPKPLHVSVPPPAVSTTEANEAVDADTSPRNEGPHTSEEFRASLDASPESFKRRNESLKSEGLPEKGSGHEGLSLTPFGGDEELDPYGAARLWKKRGGTYGNKLLPPGSRSPPLATSPHSQASSAASHASGVNTLTWQRTGSASSVRSGTSKAGTAPGSPVRDDRGGLSPVPGSRFPPGGSVSGGGAGSQQTQPHKGGGSACGGVTDAPPAGPGKAREREAM